MTVFVRFLHHFRYRLLVVYALTVITLYLMPDSGLNLGTSFIFGIRKDHFCHALMFTPLATLLLIEERNAMRWLPLVLLLAAAIEAIHLLVPWRSFSGWDSLANATGALIGEGARRVLRIWSVNPEGK